MSLPTTIIDGGGEGNEAKVNRAGCLAIGPVEYSELYSVNCAVIDTAYNIVQPASGMQIVITSLLFSANRNVGANDATVDLYEASSPTSISIDKTLAHLEIPKQQFREFNPIQLLVNEGKYINVKTNDNEVLVTLGWFAVPTDLNAIANNNQKGVSVI